MTEAIAAAEAEKPVEVTTDPVVEQKSVEKVVEQAKEAPVEPNKVEAEEKSAEPEKAIEDAKAGIPDDWREVSANGDAKLQKLMERYQSPAAMARALLEKDALIRTSKIIKPMPDPRDEKAMAEWRADQGIPAEATGLKGPAPYLKHLVDVGKPVLASVS